MLKLLQASLKLFQALLELFQEAVLNRKSPLSSLLSNHSLYSARIIRSNGIYLKPGVSANLSVEKKNLCLGIKTMTPTAEQLIETIRNLPEAEREKFFDLAEAENLHRFPEKRTPAEDVKFRQAMKWIKDNREQYKGQWVALDGDKLLASGTDGQKVHAEARTKGVEFPFMHRVSVKETDPFGGW